MGTMAKIDVSNVDRFAEKMERYGDKSGKVVQEYLGNEGFDRITTHIQGLVHASGRRWKKKATSATAAGRTTVFQKSVETMTLTVSTKKRYNYLYFPDDGSTSVHHAGNQQFMRRGAEEATNEIVDELVERLTAAFEEA